MNLARLAARQKKLRDWEDYISQSGNVQTESLRAKIVNTLQDYRSVIGSCWENSSFTEADEFKLRDLERELDGLHDQARVTVVGRKSGKRA